MESLYCVIYYSLFLTGLCLIIRLENLAQDARLISFKLISPFALIFGFIHSLRKSHSSHNRFKKDYVSATNYLHCYPLWGLVVLLSSASYSLYVMIINLAELIASPNYFLITIYYFSHLLTINILIFAAIYISSAIYAKMFITKTRDSPKKIHYSRDISFVLS